MFFDLFYIVLSLLCLSFLIFVHELGHYFAAKRVGMRVEVFSIGFGKAIYSWKRQEETWQICIFLFGGYVKIAGLDDVRGRDGRLVEDGFYSKSVWQRIQVVLAGPVVNLFLAFLLFTFIWVCGGRVNNFQNFTNIIGWVSPSSDLAKKGVQPGDAIVSYGNVPVKNFKDFMQYLLLHKKSSEVVIEKRDYFRGTYFPFHYQMRSLNAQKKEFLSKFGSLGIQPASYVIFSGFQSNIGDVSPMAHSGIHQGDRIIWANGRIIFSIAELSHVINQNDVYLTVERQRQRIHVRVPRVFIQDLQLTAVQRNSFVDWKHALNLPLEENTFFIPYEIDTFGYVKAPLSYIDTDTIENKENQLNEEGDETSLQIGDCIVAINNMPVSSGLEIFNNLRMRQILLIVSRGEDNIPFPWREGNERFIQSIPWHDLQEIISRLGSSKSISQKENLFLLHPVEPITISAFQNLLDYQSNSEKVILPKQQTREEKRYLFLGAGIRDHPVVYNPTPNQMFLDGCKETFHTLIALITGSVSPKWLVGPVGIMQIMQSSWNFGFLESVYWVGLVSLSLGLFNLIPIPVLDGGHVCFALWELITRKSIQPKTMEKIIFPFIVALILLFIYITYHDISRLLR